VSRVCLQTSWAQHVGRVPARGAGPCCTCSSSILSCTVASVSVTRHDPRAMRVAHARPHRHSGECVTLHLCVKVPWPLMRARTRPRRSASTRSATRAPTRPRTWAPASATSAAAAAKSAPATTTARTAPTTRPAAPTSPARSRRACPLHRFPRVPHVASQGTNGHKTSLSRRSSCMWMTSRRAARAQYAALPQECCVRVTKVAQLYAGHDE